MELIRAIPHVSFSELKSYLRHLLVPALLWKRSLYKYFSCVICQSDSGRARLSKLLKSRIPVYSIPPGINRDEWKSLPALTQRNAALKLLYLGTASSIRGFEICLRAYRAVSDLDISLDILARGASEEQVKAISGQLEALDIANKTQLIGGWMGRDDMIACLNEADIVVLPFVLVPSELPVSVMEVIACGKPVITTDIDGLPSTVGSAGIIVRQGSVKSLVAAISGVYHNRQELERLKRNCLEVTSRMYAWEEMYRMWLEKINDNDDQ
jgi:glycosyltransferase involved in cell wall biosynthesis